MKAILFGIFLLAFTQGYNQTCKTYYFFQNNKTIEISFYGKKGEATGKQVYTVSNVSTSGCITTADVHSEVFDKKGKTITKGTSSIKCSGGVLMVDLKMSMPQMPTGETGDATAKADNIYMEYPASMKVGDQLKDGNMEMNIETNGIKQSIKMEMTNRKVEGKESVTTSAGTWECFKITYNTKITIKTMGVGVPMKSVMTEWFAPGFGVVKSASDHGGTEVTAIR